MAPIQGGSLPHALTCRILTALNDPLSILHIMYLTHELPSYSTTHVVVSQSQMLGKQ